jgi:rod shape determining protein RodA
MDVPLLLGLITVITAGFFILYSATGQDLNQIGRQSIRFVIGFSVLYVMAQISPLSLQRWTPKIFIAGIFMLLAVLYFGDIGKGAQRWLNLGFVRFQPSELIKIALPMMIAWYLAEMPLPPRFRNLLVCAVLIAVPSLLVARQPDLGTALLIACAGFFALFLAGMSWKILWGTAISFVALAYPLWEYALKDYQRTRILTFLNPENDPLGAGYHIIQSKIAVGSGGLYGKGWLNGTQSQLDFLPERTTDFIFAVFSEEFGLFGGLILFSMYLFIIIRGLYIATQAQDTYSRLLAGSLSLTFFVYIFVNIGMVIGLLPVVGVPLPLVSYGGSSIVTLMAGFGILMSIHTHRKMLSPQ